MIMTFFVIAVMKKSRKAPTPVPASLDSSMQAMTPYSMGNQIGRLPEMEPLNAQSPMFANFIDNKCPLEGYIPDRTCLEPSAPPVGDQVAPPYEVAISHRSSTSSANSHSPPDIYGHTHSPPGDASHHTCPSCAGPTCAPPSYEESRQHPIMRH